MANNNNNVKFERGYLERVDAKTEGKAIGSLELWVNKVEQSTTPSGEIVLNLNTNGHFSKIQGIDYALGADAYSGENGLMYVQCTAWSMVKDRLIKLNVRKGFKLRIYGTFEKETYQANDGTPRTAVRVKAIKQFEVDVWPKDNNENEAPQAPQDSQPAPQQAPQTAPPLPQGNPAQVPTQQAAMGNVGASNSIDLPGNIPF